MRWLDLRNNFINFYKGKQAMRYLLLLSVCVCSGCGMHGKGEFTIGTTDFHAEGQKTKRVQHHKETDKLMIMKAEDGEIEEISQKIIEARPKEKVSKSLFDVMSFSKRVEAAALKNKEAQENRKW